MYIESVTVNKINVNIWVVTIALHIHVLRKRGSPVSYLVTYLESTTETKVGEPAKLTQVDSKSALSYLGIPRCPRSRGWHRYPPSSRPLPPPPPLPHSHPPPLLAPRYHANTPTALGEHPRSRTKAPGARRHAAAFHRPFSGHFSSVDRAPAVVVVRAADVWTDAARDDRWPHRRPRLLGRHGKTRRVSVGSSVPPP